jgi:hypothetical protein
MPLMSFHRSAIVTASFMLALTLSHERVAAWDAQQSSRVDARVGHFLTPHAPGSVIPPSISVAIGVDGRLVMARGYGEARPAKLANERTVYQIGSLAKQFTAAAVLRLIEEKASCPISGAPLTLDTPILERINGPQSSESVMPHPSRDHVRYSSENNGRGQCKSGSVRSDVPLPLNA